MNKTDLIKTVRGLDQTGPGANGEGLQRLWNCLAASSSDGQFFAAEESTLRWLLKSMNGPSAAAETLRRYPLTWTILACVLQRVPLFPLAKSFADRKFVAVLQQTLKDISKPATGPCPSVSSKRKRSPAVGYDLNELQSHHGCLETAAEVFKSLQLLLRRLETPDAAFSRHEMGAEHIKSLFCTSAAEAVSIAAPALTVCRMLVSDWCSDIGGSESWIATISMIWHLHLQGDDDAVEVATHLFTPAAIILSKIGSFPSDYEAEIPGPLKNQWSADLQLFMHRNLIIPGKRDFSSHRVFEPFDRALDISTSAIQLAAPALFFLSSGVPDLTGGGKLRKGNVEWLRQIFKAVERKVEARPNRSIIMQTILDQAIRRSTPVDVEDLRRVCRGYALHGPETDWVLVSKVATCDPDIFQLAEDGHALRGEICDRILKRGPGGDNDGPILAVIGAIMDGFRTRRALPSFLRLWFEQLCKEEKQQQIGQHSLWSKVGQLSSQFQPLSSFLEKELSPSQVLGIISWAESQGPELYPQSICVFASAIALALRSESYVDAVGTRLLDLVSPMDGSAQESALKWRVVSKTMFWAAPGDRIEIWNSIKRRLSKILKKSPVVSSVTFEAFKCCFHAWDYLSQEALAEEPASLIENFFGRLVSQDLGPLVVDGHKLSLTELNAEAEFEEKRALQQYLAWCACGSSRFSRLYFARKGDIPPILSNALSAQKSGVEELQTVWQALLGNEININDAQIARGFVDRLVAALEGTGEATWADEQSLTWIKMLASIPSDVFSRGQREKLMSILGRQRTSMARSPNQISIHAWRLVLSLSTKMMGRPTFYLDMSFSDLVEIAAAMSSISVDCSTRHEVILELNERFFLLASATIRQMADHLDERSIIYFREASKFVFDCGAQITTTQPEASTPGLALSVTLIKALTGEWSRAAKWQSHPELASLATESKAVLASCVAITMNRFISDRKLLASTSTGADMNLLAALDAARAVDGFDGLLDPKSSAVRKLDRCTRQMMQQGDLRGWKLQAFLRSYLSEALAVSHSSTYESLGGLPSRLRQPLLKELVTSTTRHMSGSEQRRYLGELVDEFGKGCDTDGQVLAIETVVDLLTDSFEHHEKTDGFSLAAAHSELTLSLSRTSPHATHICHILRTLLEKRPQAMGQWNVEITLSTVCGLSASSDGRAVPFLWLCKLVEVVIKKHRLRLEGHYHLLLSALQALLQNLVTTQAPTGGDDDAGRQEQKAHAYGRLISLVCEPTAGAVSRSQRHGALESATDAAKRSASRHMYLVMMQYVKLQLEASVPRAVREALEPAMNAIFDITPPEVRRILNDAVQGGGRAVLREMFKRYERFGKWSGV